VDHGVKIFRVDNPHTKQFAFWEWMIREVQREHPEVIFLAEAFTRPKKLYGLAKLGFTQSYTYFTWRTNKQELTDFFTEWNQPAVSDFARPNLFANTPDILHEYLQIGGRPAFLIRLVLAATLGPTYGIYSGYELCEDQAVAPGSEEYLDSEKYQYRPRDWDAPGNIIETVTRVNELRRSLPALQHSNDLWFLPIANDNIIAYHKSAPAVGGPPTLGRETDGATGERGGEHVIVLVNLDPRNVQEGWVGLPMTAMAMRPDEPFIVRDLLTNERFMWRGEWNFVSLAPHRMPAHILVVESHVGSERERMDIY
jgi:starch synthase (maltosyl-transferring)